MSKEYSQEQITRFFQQFKNLENSFTKEKVHHIINDPTAKARYKVKTFKHLNLIIMTFLISISVILALMFSSPEQTQTNKNIPNPAKLKQEVIVSDKSTQTDHSEKETDKKVENTSTKEIAIQTNQATKETEEKVENKFTEEKATQTENSLAIGTKQLANADQEKPALNDTLVDGSKFILELSIEELEKLGFQINHYSVFYRNSYQNRNVFYLATHFNGHFSVRGDNIFYNMKDYYPLQIDTIPESCSITYMDIISLGMGNTPEDRIRNDIEYFKSSHSFFPLFNSNQTGEIVSIDDQLKFDEVADTLMPVVVKCSQLDLEVKRDQFFWFITNDDFYSNLPLRYAWVKEEFEALKSAKKARAKKLDVDFHIEDWNKELLIPDNVVLDGLDKIIQFSTEELEKIGITKSKNGALHYSYNTPYGGTSLGFTTSTINGKPQLDSIDKIFNVDFYAKYLTDFSGDFLINKRTIKQLDGFINDNDILFPVQIENKNGDIYWFTLSNEFWKLVPERYQYLREYYSKMLYNKSIEPNRDFVRYFSDPFKKIEVDVPIIELNKEELENLGFQFANGGSEINCGFGENWIQYRFKDAFSEMPDNISSKTKELLSRVRKEHPPYEHVSYISPNRKFVDIKLTDKFDSLFAAAIQGFQFVYITDSLGRHMSKINIQNEDIQINGEDFKYLIPISVPFSRFANPYAEDRIFWFTPTETFFNRLPDHIKEDIKREYNIVSSEEKSSELSECSYFESCQSTLKIDNLNIYPNPAQSEITIEFTLDTTQEGEISIVNIAGLQIKVLKPKTNFNEGFNSINCQLGNLNPGVYLVYIVTEKGFKTQRIVIAE